MKQRLLLSLLMLFVSVGFAVGQNTQYIIDVTFPANATKDITVTATDIAKDGAYYAQQTGNASAEYITAKKGIITIPAKDNSEKTFRITAAGAANYTFGGEIQKLLINHPTVESITASSVKLEEVEMHAATALKTLDVSGNNLKTIGVSNATALETLNISENPEFASFSGGLPQTLVSLDMHGNSLKIVDQVWDLSGLTKLAYLNVDGNQLLDVKVPEDMPASGFIKGTQDWTFQNSLKVKANDRTNVREIGEKYGLSLNFKGATWTKNGQSAPEAHSVGTDADNTVTYCFYGDGGIYLAEETTYECVLEGENGFKYKVLVTVEPAVFNLKFEDPDHAEGFAIKKNGQGDLDSDLTLVQGDKLSISAKFGSGEENYTFGGLTKHEGLALSDGSSWDSDPVICVVQGKYKSPSEDEVPFIAANIIGKDVKITFNEPSNQQDGGTMRIICLNEDKTEQVLSGGSATLPYSTKVRIELIPDDGYEAYLFINGDKKTLENDGEGKWILDEYPIEGNCEISASFKEDMYVELSALVNGEALTSGTVNQITFLQGDSEKKIEASSIASIWLRENEVCQMSFTVGNAASVTEVKVGSTKIEPTKVEPTTDATTYYYTFTPKVDAIIYITLNTLKTPAVTFDKEQTVVYDGTVKAFKYTVEPNLSGVKVTYKSPGDATPIEKPINAGVYDVAITREADTQYSAINNTEGKLIIKQATPTVTTLPTVKISEDGTKYIVEGGVANTAGEFEISETAQPITDKAHEVTVTFKAKDEANYGEATVKVEVVPEGCDALPKRAVSIETPYPTGIKSVKIMNGAAEVKSGETFTDGTGLLVLVTYEEGIDPNTITLSSSLGSGSHEEHPTYSVPAECVKAFVYVVDLDRSGTQGDLLTVKVSDELKYDYVFKLKEQKSAYTGNVIEYLKDNIEVAKDPDDKSSSFTTAPTYTVTYKSVDGLPINVGKYVVCISIKAGAVKGYKAVNNKEFEGYFEIEKASPEVDWPTATQISLGQTLKYAHLVGGGSQHTTGHFEWEDNSIVPESGKSYSVKFIPDNKNYEDVTTDSDEKVKVTVIDQRLVTYYANYGMDIKVTDATGKVYESGSPVEKGTVLTFTVAEPDEDLVLEKTEVKGAESWSSTQCTVGDKSIEIEFTFKPKTTEEIDPNSQYKVTVTESVRGAIISKPGDNVVKLGSDFDFTVSTLAADASKVVVKVDGTTLKPTNGKYVIQDVKKNTTVTVSLPNPTPLKVEVQKDYLNANKYHIGQVEIIDGEATTYYYGDVITVMADPENGVKFVKWSDGSTDKIHEITLKADTKVVASFSGVPTGIEDIESAAITTGKGFIMVKNVANAKVTVVSISGRLQAQEEVSGDTRIDVPQGIYVVVLESGSDVKRTKVIVK